MRFRRRKEASSDTPFWALLAGVGKAMIPETPLRFECSKCGASTFSSAPGVVVVKYHKATENLGITCRRCGHSWFTDTLEQRNKVAADKIAVELGWTEAAP